MPETFEDFAGQKVILRGMTVAERADFEISLQGNKRKQGMKVLRETLLIHALVDESGTPVLTDNDAAQLAESDARFIDWLFGHAQEVCGLTRRDQEELVGN